MWTASIYFNEDFLDFDVFVGGFASELEAKAFATSNGFCLYLHKTGLELVIGIDRYSIARDKVVVRIDRKWFNRVSLDPGNAEHHAQIIHAIADLTNGVKNLLCAEPEDFEINNSSYEKLFDMLLFHSNVKNTDKIKITECIAYGVCLAD